MNRKPTEPGSDAQTQNLLMPEAKRRRLSAFEEIKPHKPYRASTFSCKKSAVTETLISARVEHAVEENKKNQMSFSDVSEPTFE